MYCKKCLSKLVPKDVGENRCESCNRLYYTDWADSYYADEWQPEYEKLKQALHNKASEAENENVSDREKIALLIWELESEFADGGYEEVEGGFT
jgi:DNA-directed RNA polymerase subunit M/transcription elongation factor TFIIS